MLTNQELFNKASESLRNYGSQYGSPVSRGWGWVNPNRPDQRCALAQFTAGAEDQDVLINLAFQLGLSFNNRFMIYSNPVVKEITALFDHSPEICNSPTKLEKALQNIAQRLNLSYKSKGNVLNKVQQHCVLNKVQEEA